PSGAVSAAMISEWTFGDEWPRVVFVNGRFVPGLSRFEGLEGITVMRLAAAYREEPSLLERHLTRQADYVDPAQVFTAVNTALMHDGAVIHVRKGTTPQHPP